MEMITFDFSRPHGVISNKAGTLSPDEIDKLIKEWRSAPIMLFSDATYSFLYTSPDEHEIYRKLNLNYEPERWFDKSMDLTLQRASNEELLNMFQQGKISLHKALKHLK